MTANAETPSMTRTVTLPLDKAAGNRCPAAGAALIGGLAALLLSTVLPSSPCCSTRVATSLFSPVGVPRNEALLPVPYMLEAKKPQPLSTRDAGSAISETTFQAGKGDSRY